MNTAYNEEMNFFITLDICTYQMISIYYNNGIFNLKKKLKKKQKSKNTKINKNKKYKKSLYDYNFDAV